MNCSLCPILAHYICACQNLRLCQLHLTLHISSPGKHLIETLQLDLLQNSISKSELLPKITQLEKASQEASLQTQTLIKLSETLNKSIQSQLDSLDQKYISLLTTPLSSQSLKDEIARLEKENLRLSSITAVYKEAIEKALSNLMLFQDRVVFLADRQNSRVMKFLQQHSDYLRCGVVSRDERVLVTGSDDHTVRVWDMVEKKLVLILRGHTGSVKLVTLANSDEYVVSASSDRTIRVWSIQQKFQIALLQGSTEYPKNLFYIENCKKLVSGDYSEVTIWDFNTFEVMKTVTIEPSFNCIVPLGEDLQFFIGTGNKIDLYDFEKCQKSIFLIGCDEQISCLALSSNREIIISGLEDSSIAVWDVGVVRIVAKLEGHSYKVIQVAITKDDQFIASTSDDNTVIVWSLRNYCMVHRFNDHNYNLEVVLSFGNNFITFINCCQIGLVNKEKRFFEKVFELRHFVLDSEVFTSDEKFVAFKSELGGVVWNELAKQTECVMCDEHREVSCLDISAEFMISVLGFSNLEDNLEYWDLRRGERIGMLDGHSDGVTCVDIAVDGFHVVSASYDRTLRLWNLKELSEEVCLRDVDHAPYTIKLSRSGRFAVSGSYYGDLIVWDIENKVQYCKFFEEECDIFKTLITEEDKYIVSLQKVEGIKVWDLRTKTQVFQFRVEEEAKKWLEENQVLQSSVTNIFFR